MSRQDYETPDDFIRAVTRRFGDLSVDLAAREDNAKAPIFVSPEQNSLVYDWSTFSGNLWLNPPFKKIEPWARKCHETTKDGYLGLVIHMLVPASIGANWFRDYIHEKAYVIALNGRLDFDGSGQGFPKDCMLCLFGVRPGFEVWTWKENSGEENGD